MGKIRCLVEKTKGGEFRCRAPLPIRAERIAERESLGEVFGRNTSKINTPFFSVD